MNPFIGVVYHWIGGFAAGSFYIPYRAVKRWSWETYWLAGGFFSWLIAPWTLALLLVPHPVDAIASVPARTIGWAYFFGAMWGLGGLTFGLTMRYLGIALGMAVALGYCAAFGTLMPPIFDGTFGLLLHSPSGIITLVGIAVCLLGIAISGLAGMSKERELSPAQKKESVAEFNFGRGMLVAAFSGIMSSCFAYGLAAGKPIAEATRVQLLDHHASDLWQNLPVLIVVLAGGFTTNFLWCVALNVRNRSGHEYLNLRRRAVMEVSATEAVVPWNADELSTVPAATPAGPAPHEEAAPLLGNYFFSALAGLTWYLQFFFYSMGTTKMGKYDFSSWTLHMASIIIFSTLWGIALKEWRGTGKRTHRLIGLGLATLIASTGIVGYGTYRKQEETVAPAASTGKVSGVLENASRRPAAESH